MLKIEKAYYPVCVRVNKNKVAACKTIAYEKDGSINKMHVLVSTEIQYEDEVLLAYVFDTEMARTFFLFKMGLIEEMYPVSLKVTGDDSNELRKKIIEFSEYPKLMSSGNSLDRSSIVLLIVCESQADADRISSMASEETQ